MPKKLTIRPNTHQVRIIVDWQDIFEEHAECPEAVIFIRQNLYHATNDKVETLYIPYYWVTVDITRENVPYISNYMRVFNDKIFTILIYNLSSHQIELNLMKTWIGIGWKIFDQRDEIISSLFVTNNGETAWAEFP